MISMQRIHVHGTYIGWEEKKLWEGSVYDDPTVVDVGEKVF